MADNARGVAKTTPPSQPLITDNSRRCTRSQTKNGGDTILSVPAPEPRGKKRSSQVEPQTSGGNKGGRKVARVIKEEPQIKPKLPALNFPDTEPDPIVEHLKKTQETEALEIPSIDDAILDQIALEGLTGVKLGRLFKLIEAVAPCFKCTKDIECQNYIWSVISRKYLTSADNKVKAYLVDEQEETNLEETESSNNVRGLVLDKEIKLPHQTLKWCGKVVSALYPVQDGSIMGSCKLYKSRVDITEKLCKSNSEDDISLNEIFNKHNFDRTYFVANQDVRCKAIFPDWADPNVDVKLREYCVIELIGRSRTLGTVFPKDKTLGRYRLMLLAKGFITQFQESSSSAIEHHLRRYSFVKKSSSKYPPNKVATESSSEDDDEDNIEQSLAVLCCDPAKLKPDKGTLTLVYDVIAASTGISQLDIRREMNLPKFHIRNHLKNLISIKMICSQTTSGQAQPFRFYRTAYKSARRKKKKMVELEKPTGIMAKWDEADLRAKKIIGHRRSSFSQAEDSLLILCRITSILIEPKCRLSWCVHKRVVRDILHEELVESHNKTSDACLRRIKYLKRLSNNIMSINELTAELQDDSDIQKLTQCDKPIESDNRMQKLFTQVLKTVRAKIPNLLGISSTVSSRRMAAIGVSSTDISVEQQSNNSTTSREAGVLTNITDHKELQEKYELVDCQSVASIVRAPTYEKAKNVVDVKFNNASLVTMAFTLSSCLSGPNSSISSSGNGGGGGVNEEVKSKQKVYRWLLDKFYADYPDKLISSALSKLNKRSLLTRKCPAEQASLYKPKTRTSLKLNQSVLFLLTRYHSASLIQLAQPLAELPIEEEKVEEELSLKESNEMSSIALLASLCSSNSFENELRLKIPSNVVDVDHQSNEKFKILIVQPCNVKFKQVSFEPITKPLESFLEEARASDLIDAEALVEELQQQQQQQRPPMTNWLVKSFRLPSDADMSSNSEKDWESKKINIEYSARLWKRIDGSVDLLSLFKLIESLLSWIVFYPGVEYKLLRREFDLLMPEEHLEELLNLMEQLDLISSQSLEVCAQKPRLFGYSQVSSSASSTKDNKESRCEAVVYEATASAYVRYCQLLSHFKPQRQQQQQ